MPAPPPSAKELVERAAAGDAGAWEALVERYANLVWSVARSFRLDRADAADVSQTTWLRLVEHLGRLRDPQRLGAWLATTARHESLRVLRRAGRQVPIGEEEELEQASAADAVPLDLAIITAERDASLWTAFAHIPPRCRSLLRLLAADPPPSYDEISAALEMPVGSIGPTRARCLEHLRRRLQAEGISRESGGSRP